MSGGDRLSIGKYPRFRKGFDSGTGIITVMPAAANKRYVVTSYSIHNIGDGNATINTDEGEAMILKVGENGSNQHDPEGLLMTPRGEALIITTSAQVSGHIAGYIDHDTP